MTTVPVKQSSIWDKLDFGKVVNVVFNLEYVALSTHSTSTYAEIGHENISTELEYWRNSIVYYFLGAHPPFEVIKGYIQRIWGKFGLRFGLNRIVMLKNGVILVRFDIKIERMR